MLCGMRGKPCSWKLSINMPHCILGDPGAVSRVDKMFVVKVYCKIETSPWALTLTEPVPEAFELPASDFFWPISEEKLPGDSRVFLHDVVFLIDRHSCVARSTGKVSRGKFQNKMLITRKNYNLYHGYKKQTLSDEFVGRIFPRYRQVWYNATPSLHFRCPCSMLKVMNSLVIHWS